MRHSKGTWALGNRRALRHLRHSGTRALESHSRHLDTSTLRHLGTGALERRLGTGVLGQLGTRGFLFSRLPFSNIISTISQLLKFQNQCRVRVWSSNSTLYRPIDTAIISKAPHFSPSQCLISPIVENHVNDTRDNDIINKLIPSINRSLLLAAMAGINTAHRVLTIGNSSLNANFEFLESKLYGKIMPMK